MSFLVGIYHVLEEYHNILSDIKEPIFEEYAEALQSMVIFKYHVNIAEDGEGYEVHLRILDKKFFVVEDRKIHIPTKDDIGELSSYLQTETDAILKRYFDDKKGRCFFNFVSRNGLYISKNRKLFPLTVY